jgi:hypothetical protein
MNGGPNGTERPQDQVRTAIRDLLTASTHYQNLDAPTRREIAQGLVKICSAALALPCESEAATGVAAKRLPLALAESAGGDFSGVAAQRVAGTTQQILNAVSFPRFVTELINGVFKALVDTNQQQLHSYVELIQNVAASTAGFADANVGLDGARRWLVERFPGSFTVEGGSNGFDEPGQPLSPEDQAQRDAETQLRLRPGASMPTEAALRVALGLGPQDSLPGGDPENLVALARTALARNRQQMLSTMVMLGLQRIVIESGRLHAAMRFHIDTGSAAQADSGSQLDLRNTTSASGSFGYGPWGASASMTNTIGYVTTQKTQTTEEMNTDLDLNSSVELIFKTDYLPLDRLAGRDQVDRIKVNTLNPEAEEKAATETRSAREKRIAESEAGRRASLDKAIAPPPAAPSGPAPGAPGSPEAAERARQTAAGATHAGVGTAPATGGTSLTRATGSHGTAGGESSPAGGTAPRGAAPPAVARGATAAGRQAGAGNRPPAGISQALAAEAAREDKPSVPRKPDVIFAPTPPEAIDEMLVLSGLQSGECLYDLGCGDGSIVVAAAKKYGCRAVGFDIDPRRIAESRANVSRNGMGHLVSIVQQDIFEVDLGPADVVTVYLLPGLNQRLISQFEKMKPGARIVSHDFDMDGVIPDRAVQVYLAGRHQYKTFYLWTTPLKMKKSMIPARHEWAESKGLTVA